MELTNVVDKIQQVNKNIILIYGFNGTGKTNLSRRYLHKTAHEGKPSGVYYNAFSEDIFSWNNDTENEGTNTRFLVKESRLNDFHSGFTEKEVHNKLEPFGFEFDFKFTFHEDIEKGIKSVVFFKNKDTEGEINTDKEEDNIKISRGEERIFVWCFFLALFEKGDLFESQPHYFFIDDPVSSLDDHNIFTTASTIYNLIEKYHKNKKIIITTHHIGLFSILSNQLTKGRESKKYQGNLQRFFLNRKDNKVVLQGYGKGTFMYHLYLWHILEKAQGQEDELRIFHFVLLRQILEIVSSFFGARYFGYALELAEVDNHNNTADKINSLSHQSPYQFQNAKMNAVQKKMFNNVMTKLKEKYMLKPKQKAKK